MQLRQYVMRTGIDELSDTVIFHAKRFEFDFTTFLRVMHDFTVQCTGIFNS
jgi:hypothetical protein